MREESPSDTAALIARSLLLAAQDDGLRALLAEGEEEILRRILQEVRSRWFDFAIKKKWARGILNRTERVMLPGIFAHYLARKRRIEEAVWDAFDWGATQVVIVAAGFDTLGWRLHKESPLWRVIEIDHPATQEVKQRALPDAEGFAYLPVRIGEESLLTALRDCPEYSEERGTVVVVEGLMMYLPEDDVELLLHELAGMDPLRVIFSFMEKDAKGGINFRGQSGLVRRWLKWRREPFLWGEEKDEIPRLLKRCGLSAEAIINHRDLRDEILLPRGLGEIALAEGECICICSPKQ